MKSEILILIELLILKMKQFFVLLFIPFLVMALAEEDPAKNEEKNSNLSIDQSGEDIPMQQQRCFGKFY